MSKSSQSVGMGPSFEFLFNKNFFFLRIGNRNFEPTIDESMHTCGSLGDKDSWL